MGLRFRIVVAVAVSVAAISCARAVAGSKVDRKHPSEHPYGGPAHARPRALAVDARGDLLYVALSTADSLAVFDVTGGNVRPLPAVPVCEFPDALAPLPGGGVVVACRFDPGLRLVTRVQGGGPKPRFQVRVVDAGPEHGHQGIAVDGSGRFVYVASPPRGGIKIVDLVDSDRPARFVATGCVPRAVRFIPVEAAVGAEAKRTAGPLLLVSNFIGHTVTIHDVLDDGGLSPARQTISTEAPVLDLGIVPAGLPPGLPLGLPAGLPAGLGLDGADDGAGLGGALLLLTHEDRKVSREQVSVEGLDSVVLVLRRSPVGSNLLFVDPGLGKRTSLNLTERARTPLVGLDAMAFDPLTGRVAIVGAGTDNIVVAAPRADLLLSVSATPVGANPSAVAFLPDGRVATADRLSDTISFVRGGTAPDSPQTISVGTAERPNPADRGEVLFFSRALVPNNVADGPLSVYTCAACHADGHIDGRRHPSKRNRFFSMTKTCRGLSGTEPFLSIGKPDTFVAFADNIVATHAQGALHAPGTFDRYPVLLRMRAGAAWTDVTMSPEAVREALAAYMARIPVEPSPFVAPGRTKFTTSERRGLEVFRENCGDCHQLVSSTRSRRPISAQQLESRLLHGRVALTAAGLHDVGTPVLGEGGNNPPSLRGVWAAAPYFSDGSAATLEEVVRRTNPDAAKIHAAENGKEPPAFSAAKQVDLLAFLRAL